MSILPGQNDAVASFLLGPIQRRIHTLKQSVRRVLTSMPERHADTAGDPMSAEIRRLRFPAQQLRLTNDRFPLLHIHQDHELFSAPADTRASRPHAAAYHLSKGGQYPVAGHMSELIIDPLEMIDVQQKHRKSMPAALHRLGNGGRQQPVQDRTVPAAGQNIRLRTLQRPRRLPLQPRIVHGQTVFPPQLFPQMAITK